MRVPHGLEEEQGSEDSTEHPVSPAGMLQSREHGHGSGSQTKSSPGTGWETILREGGRKWNRAADAVLATASAWPRTGTGLAAACAAALRVSSTVLGSSQALQLLKAGTCTHTWHHSWPLSTLGWPHRKSLDRVAWSCHHPGSSPTRITPG